MRYYLKYPTAGPGFTCDSMARIHTVYPCWDCDTPTSWIDEEFGEAVCSTECRHRLHLIAGKGDTLLLKDDNEDVGFPF